MSSYLALNISELCFPPACTLLLVECSPALWVFCVIPEFVLCFLKPQIRLRRVTGCLSYPAAVQRFAFAVAIQCPHRLLVLPRTGAVTGDDPAATLASPKLTMPKQIIMASKKQEKKVLCLISSS